jgi:FixJ family two-component response regulator
MVLASAEPVVLVVDDDLSVRKLIARLLEFAGYRVRTFISAEELLNTQLRPQIGCLMVDVHLPGLDGLALQERMLQQGTHLPVVFITGAGDIPTAVQAMKQGAVDFLSKPLREETLLQAVKLAIERSRAEQEIQAELAHLKRQYSRLTPREVEVLGLVAAGKLNKQVAAELGIAEKTVKIHRGRLMQKLHVHSVADLVRLYVKMAPPRQQSAQTDTGR